MNASTSGSTSAGAVVCPEPERLHRRHPERAGAVHVVMEAVADEERRFGVDAELVEGRLEDRRIGLPGAHLAGQDDRVDTRGDSELVELAANEPRGLRPRVRNDRKPQAAPAQRVEQSMCAVDERARRTPRGVLGVEEAIELLVGDRAEQIAQLVAVVDACGGVLAPISAGSFSCRKRAVNSSASAAAPERAEPRAVPRREQLVVPFELRQRPAPVKENRLEHAR